MSLNRTMRGAIFGTLMTSIAAPYTFAQDASPEPEPAPAIDLSETEATELPEVVVETAPAKRNIKKERLRASGGTSSSGTAAPSDQVLPEVVVEGEKVVRTLRDSTTSIGVVTGQQIQQEQIQDLQEVLNSQANVLATKQAGGNAGFSIRGINSEGFTQNNNPSAAPLTSVVIDGATQNAEATRRGARSLWDVEQVEILRGPQSALQARNSLAGSIFIKTKDPTYKWQVITEGTVGQEDLKSGGFVLNAPIATNQAALRISGQIYEREHDISYANPDNNPLDDDMLRSIRGKLLLEPDSIPGLSALFTVSRVKDTPATLSVTEPFEDRFLATNDPTSAVDFRTTEAKNYISDIAYKLTSSLTIRSITAYADTRTDIGTPEDAFYQRSTVRDGGDFTQDLRLELENQGNGWSGVAGLFYGSFKTKNKAFDTVDYPGVLNAQFGFGDNFSNETIQDLTASTHTESVAAYADLRYRFWDRYVFIGGGRILRDKVSSKTSGNVLLNTFNYPGEFIAGAGFDADFNFVGPQGPCAGLVTPGDPFGDPTPCQRFGTLSSDFSDTFTEFLPKIGITYDLTPDQTVGFTYNEGYRNGYTEFRQTTGQFNTIKPEYLDAYELSYRSNWLNNRLSINANVFYYEYENQQVVFDEIVGGPFDAGALGFPLSYIINADESHAYGSELSMRWRPTSTLQLYGSVGLMRTEFDSFDVDEGNFTGNEFPGAPGYTVALGGIYKHPSGYFAGANMRHTDGYYSGVAGGDLGNDPLRYVEDYTLVDARIGYEWEKYTLTVFAKNLFDEEYVTNIRSGGTGATVGDGRLFGVTLRGEF